MPTQRPRLTLTETPEIARRLDLAAAHYPALAGSRKELLLRLTEVGEKALNDGSVGGGDARAEAKRQVLERTREISQADAQAMLAAREADWHQDTGS
jgi:hypothetical protein